MISLTPKTQAAEKAKSATQAESLEVEAPATVFYLAGWLAVTVRNLD